MYVGEAYVVYELNEMRYYEFNLSKHDRKYDAT